jgi:hypothetical protein
MSGDATKGQSGRPSGRAELVQRITVLLGEIEALGQQASDMPSPLLTEMRAILEKARNVLEACRSKRVAAAGDGEGDPQPDVDREILERMYRALGTGRAPKR